MALSLLSLKKREERRLLGGHHWVYSNEVDVSKTPLTSFTPGQQVIIEAANGKALGMGYVNPHSLICARLVSHDSTQILDKNLLITRLKRALALREQLFAQPFYRLIFGESDGLPGLVIDRYDDTLVVQITTAGMEQLKIELKDALCEVLAPKAILLRNDTSIREQEGLDRYIETLYGEPADRVELIENDVRYLAPIKDGQKTGWFYDHRYNRARLKPYVSGKRVLDMFCYSGAWSLQAAHAGAREVCCVDASAPALELLQANAKLNKLQDKIKVINEDAFIYLTKMHEAQEKFDVIILDPPAFIKRRKDITKGGNAYRRLNQLAVRLLNPNGILVSAACSLHLTREDLIDAIRGAGVRNSRNIQILEQGHQAADHPVHPAIPETDYLKMFIARVD